MVQFATIDINPRAVCSIEQRKSLVPERPYMLKVWFTHGGSFANSYATEAEREADRLRLVAAIDAANGIAETDDEEELKKVRGFTCL